MIVYGDHSRRVSISEVLADIAAWPDGRSDAVVDAHACLVTALIEAGQLAQALADEDVAQAGCQRQSPMAAAAMRATMTLASLVGRSWSSGFYRAARRPIDGLTELRAAPDGDRVLCLREPEGYAHYAVYPESYWRAAAGWSGGPRPRVIGIRSIGTSLSAMVAAAAGAPVPHTVRPIGPPFERKLDLAPDYRAKLADPVATGFAVVDEGPGLSGSSFGAVADALEQGGLEPSRITFFPSHGQEPGPQASMRHRDRWRISRRLVTPFDDLVFDPQHPAQRLEVWVADLTGTPTAPFADISGGRWRSLQRLDQSEWPPSDAGGERRKFLLPAERGTFLLKFSGLGRGGMRHFEQQRKLAAAGFALPPAGWRHGFTVEPWRSDLRPLRSTRIDRATLVVRLGAYLAFRAKHLPAEGRSGASLDALFEMLTINAGESLGGTSATGLEMWRPWLPALSAAVRPVATDNRLQAWEWLVTAQGQIVKTDAVDHHAGHDLIGCQDIAWDVAGASIEFDLAPEETAAVSHRIGQACGRDPDPMLVRFCRCAYAAFQIGACERAAGRSEAADRRRWADQGTRYREALWATWPGALP